jgi:hypothetical protein
MVLWRAYIKVLTTDVLLAAILVPIGLTYVFPGDLKVDFLPSQRRVLQAHYESLSDKTQTLEIVRSWNVEEGIVSPRSIAIVVMSFMILGWDQRKTWIHKSLTSLGLLLYLSLGANLISLALVKYALPLMIPASEMMKTMNYEQVSSFHRESLKYVVSIPLISIATAMASWVASLHVLWYLGNRTDRIGRSALIFNVICPALILSFSVVAFGVLRIW